MGRIDRLLAKPIEVDIGGEKETIKPFTVKDLPMITRMGSKDIEVAASATQDAVLKVLRQIDSEATEDVLFEVSIEHLEDVMTAIAKANDLDISEAKQKFLDKVKKSQSNESV